MTPAHDWLTGWLTDWITPSPSLLYSLTPSLYTPLLLRPSPASWLTSLHQIHHPTTAEALSCLVTDFYSPNSPPHNCWGPLLPPDWLHFTTFTTSSEWRWERRWRQSKRILRPPHMSTHSLWEKKRMMWVHNYDILYILSIYILLYCLYIYCCL
jgi:hypothetical protein